jgi:long-chain fatty acid transport protein
MYRSLRALAALLLAVAAVPALATNGMRMTGLGAVQNGMGGVGTALTLDTSTIVSNPAGLSDLSRRLDASVTWFVPTVDYQAVGAAPGVVLSTASQSSNRGGSLIPTVGLALPLGGGFTAGLGAFGVAGMGVDYDANLFASKLITSYQQLRVAPALAWKTGQFSVGFAVNLAGAQMKFAAAEAMGQVPHDATWSFGYGATIGAKFAVTKELAFGVSYETKTSFKDFEWTIPAHNDYSTGVPIPLPGGTDRLKFDQPAVLAGGVSWQATSPLVLGLDVEWINWSSTNGKNQPAWKNDTNLTGAMPFNLDWSDQVVLKVGAEYAVTPVWKVRAGYDYGKNPLDKSQAFESIAFPAIAEHHVSLGLGWNATEALAINLAGTYSPRSKQSGANMGQGIVSYSTSMSQYALDLGLGWAF